MSIGRKELNVERPTPNANYQRPMLKRRMVQAESLVCSRN
jgi:hypothetical protein